jgi:hypothetical protein
MDQQGVPVPVTFSNKCSLRHYHCIWSGMSHPSAGRSAANQDAGGTGLQLLSPDVPLVAFMTPGNPLENIMHMDLSDDDSPDMTQGLFFNLLNTLNAAWIRQYPWKAEDYWTKYRFSIVLSRTSLKSDDEDDIVKAKTHAAFRSLALSGSITSAGASDVAGASCSPCSLNGEYIDGRCQCRLPFGGPKCAQLQFEATPPLQPHAFGQRAGDNVTSWGGNALLGADGQWHLFVAAMVKNCGMEAWTTNSEIVHATASTPEGPYTRADTTLPLWAHGPQVARGPPLTGPPELWHWYIFHDGAGNGRSVHRARNCNGTAVVADARTGEKEARHSAGDGFGNLVHVADAPSGPWRAVGTLTNCSDPAPLWHAGAWWLVCHGPPQPGVKGCKLEGHRCTTLQTASTVAGPWSVILRFPANPPGTGVWEDPFVVRLASLFLPMANWRCTH